MIIHYRKDLTDFSTFGLKACSRYLVEFDDDKDLLEVSDFVQTTNLPALSIGGGSNIIFCADYPGVVIKNTARDIERLSYTSVRVSAGCALDDFIAWCITNNYFGIESLSGIPGTIGGAVALNAGAYGSTIKDYLSQVRVYDIRTRKLAVFTTEELHYWHRSSVFREKRGNDWLILDATFKLRRKLIIPYHTKTHALSEKVKKSAVEFRNSVIDLRSHMPNPYVHRNSGSFFLNPTLTNKRADKLKFLFPDVASRPYTPTHAQVSAGWLLDNAGLRGQKYEGLYFHQDHANIVINEKAQTGRDLASFIRYVQQVIYSKFGIHIQVEPLLICEEFWQGALLKPTIKDTVRAG